MSQTPRMQLQCPMPKVDFEIITLGHGSGGTLTHQLLETGVFELLKNDMLDERHDGAVFELSGKTAFSTDSFLVSPIFFPGGNIGELAVNGTVNDLAMCGAVPQFLSLSFIIEEGLPFADFWAVLDSIKQASQRAGVQIVTGDTKVVERGKGDKLFINTSGVGKVLKEAQISVKNITEGDKIIVSGAVATHGMAIMSVREGLSFDTAIRSDTRPLHRLTTGLIERFGSDIHLLTDPTRGGVATVLNEIAQSTNLGMRLAQNALPIEAQVSSACELLGLDPLYVANEGIFLTFVPAQCAQEVLETLQQYPEGKEACIIGEVVAEHPKKVTAVSPIGGRRVIGMLAGEQLPRIC